MIKKASKQMYSPHGRRLKYWPRFIINRIKNERKNFMGFFSGETGSGKSWSCLSSADDCDTKGEFSVENCYFSVEDYLKDVRDKKLRRGSAAVMEEVGVSANVREWQSKNNLVLNKLTQTYRKRGIITFFNAPSWMFFDSATRKLMHSVFSTVTILKKEGVCLVRPYRLQYNDLIDKIYWHKLRVQTGHGVVPINIWSIPKPRKELSREYEKRKDEYMAETESKLAIVLEQRQKVKLKQYAHHCKHCGHNWISHVEKINKCPYCKRMWPEEKPKFEGDELKMTEIPSK